MPSWVLWHTPPSLQPPTQRARRSSNSYVVSSALCGCLGHPLQFMSRHLPCSPHQCFGMNCPCAAMHAMLPRTCHCTCPAKAACRRRQWVIAEFTPRHCCVRKTSSCCALFRTGLYLPQSLKSEKASDDISREGSLGGAFSFKLTSAEEWGYNQISVKMNDETTHQITDPVLKEYHTLLF